MMVLKIRLAGIKQITSIYILMKKKFSKNAKFGDLCLKSFKKKDKENYSLISVITPNYKSPNLKKSIKSVLNQTFKNVELILIDVDFEKKTIDMLKRYNTKIDFWLSERDKGTNSFGGQDFRDLGNSVFSKKHNFLKTLSNEIEIMNDNGQNKFVLLYIIIGRSIRKFLIFCLDCE